MSGFLREIIAQLDIRDPEKYLDACFVFPTRRAGYYFRQSLAELYPGKSMILPEILTIEDFVQQHSGLVIPDELSLIVTLYHIFNGHQTQDFESFYPWGKMVLRDFEEADKYLVDTAQLYSVLKSHREMEEAWGLGQEDLAVVREFWDNVQQKGDTAHKDHFIRTWSVLKEVYTAFRETLLQHGSGHTGMAYRKLCIEVEDGTTTLPYSLLVFAGFNALSAAEERIFKACLKQGHTHIFWDSDDYYMQDGQQESGNFLRRYREDFQHPHVHWIAGNNIAAHKGIYIKGIASGSGLAQEAARLAGEVPPSHSAAVVLCNEQLMMPLLYALDPGEREINITMGYPARYSTPYQVTELLYQLYRHNRDFSGQTVFFHHHLRAFFGHPGIQHWIGHEPCQRITEALVRYNRIWAGVEWMERQSGTALEPLSLLLPPPADGLSFGQRLSIFFDALAGHASSALDRHICLHLSEIVHRFNAVLQQYDLNVSLEAGYKLLRQHLYGCSIPFEGSHAGALQVMGFLETRVLDFDALIIVSANENHLPAPNRHRSFIPYHLRKGFGLPTFEEQDAIYAYHFYRLLQRSRRVHLLYNTGGDKQDSEPSRFIRQLLHEHPSGPVAAQINLPAQPVSWESRWPEGQIVIPKTAEMIGQLATRSFSPSALNTYLTCPVQFYLNYIAGLDEAEEISETMDNLLMGRVLHKAMELCYLPFVGKEVTATDIEAMAGNAAIDHLLQHAFEAEMGESALQVNEGKNYLILEVLRDIIGRFLQWDMDSAPFTILGLEEKMTISDFHLSDGRKVSLQGRIDRRDRVILDGRQVERVIDYKTGHVNLSSTHNRSNTLTAEEYTSRYFQPGNKLKEGFQGYMYTLLLQGTQAEDTGIMAGFYSARRFGEGIVWVRDGRPVPADVMEAFRARLRSLMEEILDIDTPFRQNMDAAAYQYSAFAGLVP